MTQKFSTKASVSQKRVLLMLFLWGTEWMSLCLAAYYFNYLSADLFCKLGILVAVWCTCTGAYSFCDQWRFKAFWHPGTLLLLITSSVLITFCFFGKSVLYNDAGLHMTLVHWPIITVLFLPVLKTVSDAFLLMTRLPVLLCSKQASSHCLPHMAILFVMQVIILGYYFQALMPGSMSYDTFNQLQQIDGSIRYTTWHPIAHTLFLKGLFGLTHTLAAQAAFHIFFYCIVTTAFAGELMKNRLRPIVLYIVLGGLAVSPHIGINLMSLWKDIPFTIGLLWAVLILYRMRTVNDYFATGAGSCKFFFCMLIIVLFRYNGVLAFIFCILYALYDILRLENAKKWRGCLAIVLCLLTVFIVTVPLPKALDADLNPAGMKLRPIYQGLGAMYEAGDNEKLAPKAQKTMERIASPEEWKAHYDPYFSDIYIKNIRLFIQKLSLISTSDSISWYVQALQQSPGVILGDRFNLGLLTWSVAPDPLSYDNRYTLAIEPDVTKIYGIVRDENDKFKIISEVAAVSSNHALPDIFFWRGGMYLALLILMLAFAMRVQRRSLPLHLPWLGNFIVVFLTMPAQDYRYIWYQALLCPFIGLAMMTLWQPEKNSELEGQ